MPCFFFQELVLGISAGLPPSVVPGIGADATAEVCVVADAVVSGASSSFGFAAAAGPVVSYVRERAAAVVSSAVAAVAPRASAAVRALAVVAGPSSRGEMHDPQTFDEAVASSAERFLYRISGVSDVDAIRWSPVFSPWWWCASCSDSPGRFVTTLADYAAVVPAGTGGLEVGGREAVLTAYTHTVRTFRAQVIVDPGGLTRVLAASRREITEWVRRDSRLSRTPIHDVHWNLTPGCYLQDYMQ